MQDDMRNQQEQYQEQIVRMRRQIEEERQAKEVAEQNKIQFERNMLD